MTDDAPTTGQKPARRGGRPRKETTERRSQWIGFRVSEDERRAIEALADRAGLDVSEYVRDMALTGRVVTVQRRELSAIDRADLGRVGANLNQLARHLNAGRATASPITEAALQAWTELAERLE